jgi:hypothetical protein
MKRQRARSIVRAIENPAVGQGAFHAGPPPWKGVLTWRHASSPLLLFSERALTHT